MESVLITGSSKGLGASLALVFAANGYNIILHGRDKPRLDLVRKLVEEKGAESLLVYGDIREQSTREQLRDVAINYNLSVLINNAGVSGNKVDKKLESISEEEISEIIDTNLLAPIYLTKIIYPIFKLNGSGTIININSMMGIKSSRIRPIYCSSKWGLKGFSESLVDEFKKDNIRMIDIYPGRININPIFPFEIKPDDIAKIIYNCYSNTNQNKLIFGDKEK